MFERLNEQTRQIVLDLIAGNKTKIGDEDVGPLDEDVQLVLQIVAEHLDGLKDLKGESLVDRFLTLFSSTEKYQVDALETKAINEDEKCWRLNKIRTYSYRGLAPAGCVWDYNFNSDSHLLYGPNGSGKSSMLGAITWCLTGKIFRDDRAPDEPYEIDIFSDSKKTKKREVHVDALSLLDKDGIKSDSKGEYYVRLELSRDTEESCDNEIYIERNSKKGLSSSKDGEHWSSINSLSDVGINPLDLELLLLMPAKIPHLKFGENSDLVKLFSEIIGVDDLSRISEVAATLTTALKSSATRTKKEIKSIELEKSIKKINELLNELESPLEVQELVADLVPNDEIIRKVEQDLEIVSKHVVDGKTKLAASLGLQVPEVNTPEYAVFVSKAKDLTRRIQSVVDKITDSDCIKEIFSVCDLEKFPSKSELSAIHKNLEDVTRDAKGKIKDRLDWALKEVEDGKALLKLVASEYVVENSVECPLCEQDLSSKKQIFSELLKLKPLSVQDHIKKNFEDLENAIINQLKNEKALLQEVSGSVADCIREDWATFKKDYFNGILLEIVNRYDNHLEAVLEKIIITPFDSSIDLLGDHSEKFADQFVNLKELILDVRRSLSIVGAIHDNSEQLKKDLNRMIILQNENGQESLRQILKLGDDSSKKLNLLEPLETDYKSVKKQMDVILNQLNEIEIKQKIAKSSESIKKLSDSVRKLVISNVQSVEDEMKCLYAKLYHEDPLGLDSITPGHAANPKVKSQFNVYLRADKSLVPVLPFSNAGRIRALCLSFVFALIEKARGSIGFLILDDPIVSLDDEHRSRFVKYFVSTKLETHQVVMATHYEDFSKKSSAYFQNHQHLNLIPRRNSQCQVTFEPGDLLDRLEKALDSSGDEWESRSINLRLWIERALMTISSYCPKPFTVYNNLNDTIENYKKIEHVEIANDYRDKFLDALNSPEIRQIKNSPAHYAESLTKSDVEDALKKLKNEADPSFRKIVERLKLLSKHNTEGQMIAEDMTVRLEVLTMDDRFTYPLNICGEAAAASGGVGVSWEENISSNLNGIQQAILTSNVISPVAHENQILLLDSDDVLPESGDLVIAQASSGERYTRRYWNHDKYISLECVNLTEPISPVVLAGDVCSVRKILGVYFDGPDKDRGPNVGNEWAPYKKQLFENIKGLRVVGTSMEPIARDGQLILIYGDDVRDEIGDNDLACVEGDDLSPVIKRCYPRGDKWILCSINPDVPEIPIEIEESKIQHVYQLAGVLFEVKEEIEIS